LITTLSGEATLFQKLHTIGLLQSHVLVGHWRQYSR